MPYAPSGNNRNGRTNEPMPGKGEEWKKEIMQAQSV
jgi:hypothetical protein